MKIALKKMWLIFLYIPTIWANHINIVNLTAAPSTITLNTLLEMTTQTAPANENQYMNDINNAESTFTVISYKNSPIKKITVTRLKTNMPQIIYYNNDLVKDEHEQLNGIYTLNASGQGIMQIWQNRLSINKVFYLLTDLSSFMIKCNQLKNSILPTNLDEIQKEVDDLSASIKLIQASDMATQLEEQTIMIESAVDAICHDIKIMTTLNKNLKIVQDLQNNLSADTQEQAEQTVHSLETGLKTLSQSGLQNSLATQAQALKNGIKTLQTSLTNMKFAQQRANLPDEVISNEKQARNEIFVNQQQARNNITYSQYS